MVGIDEDVCKRRSGVPDIDALFKCVQEFANSPIDNGRVFIITKCNWFGVDGCEVSLVVDHQHGSVGYGLLRSQEAQ